MTITWYAIQQLFFEVVLWNSFRCLWHKIANLQYMFGYPRLEGFLRAWLSPCITHYDISFAGHAPSCFCGGPLHLFAFDVNSFPKWTWTWSEMFLFSKLMKTNLHLADWGTSIHKSSHLECTVLLCFVCEQFLVLLFLQDQRDSPAGCFEAFAGFELALWESAPRAGLDA